MLITISNGKQELEVVKEEGRRKKMASNDDKGREESCNKGEGMTGEEGDGRDDDGDKEGGEGWK